MSLAGTLYQQPSVDQFENNDQATSGSYKESNEFLKYFDDEVLL